MSLNIYDVTLTDLGTYTVTVAAEDEGDAILIAKDVLHEEAMENYPQGLVIVKRETEGVATLAETQPTKRFNVNATYSLKMTVPNVPAQYPQVAQRHAYRLYKLNDGPFGFEHAGDDVSPFTATEVRS